MDQHKHQKKGKQLVLIGPAGKQAGRPDQKYIALQFAAIEKTRAGFGGGIIDLLLPKIKKQWQTVQKLRLKGYFFKAVNTRSTVLEEVRDAAVNHNLFKDLVYLFVVEKGNCQHTRRAPVKEFAAWIVKKISERDPTISQLFRSQPELLNRLSVDWWKVRIRQIRKRKK
jgi:hypothetical protein